MKIVQLKISGSNEKPWVAIGWDFRFYIPPHSKVAHLLSQETPPSPSRDLATRAILRAIAEQLQNQCYKTSEPKQGKGCYFVDVRLSSPELSVTLRRTSPEPTFELWTLPRNKSFLKGKGLLPASDAEEWEKLCDTLENVLNKELVVESIRR